MKKAIALLVALACLVSLLAACSGNDNINEETVPSSSAGSSSTTDNDTTQNQTAEKTTTTFYHRTFEITLPDHYVENGNDVWESWGEDRTEIWALDYDLLPMMQKYGVAESLEELAKAYVKEQQIEGELFKGEDDNYYVLAEGESDGQPWTELMLFFLEKEIFWEVRFYSNSRSWEDVQNQWNDYIDTIEFD